MIVIQDAQQQSSELASSQLKELNQLKDELL